MRAWQVLICFVHFPEHGSMFFPKGAIGYDPQLIKPPADYRGADDMDFAAANERVSAAADDRHAEDVSSTA